MLRTYVYCCITNLRSRHQKVSSIRACLSFHRLHYDWRIQYSDARDHHFFLTGRQRRFPAGTLARKKGTRSAWRWIAGVRAWRSRKNQWYIQIYVCLLFVLSQCDVCSPVWRFCATWIASWKGPTADRKKSRSKPMKNLPFAGLVWKKRRQTDTATTDICTSWMRVEGRGETLILIVYGRYLCPSLSHGLLARDFDVASWEWWLWISSMKSSFQDSTRVAGLVLPKNKWTKYIIIIIITFRSAKLKCQSQFVFTYWIFARKHIWSLLSKRLNKYLWRRTLGLCD